MRAIHKVDQGTINRLHNIWGMQRSVHENYKERNIYELVEEIKINNNYIYYIRLTIWAEVTLMLHPWMYERYQLKQLKTYPVSTTENNVVPFEVPKLAVDGRGPSDPTGPEWLGELETHTTFLAAKKNDSTFALGQFTIAFKTEGNKSVLLYVEGQDKPVWVNPIRFCRDFSHWDTVQTGSEYDQELKANAIAGSIQPRNLENIAPVQEEPTSEGDVS